MTATEWVLIGVALITTSGAWVTARYGRLARVEARLASVEALNRRLWAYVRRQHDHAYRSGYQPLPIPESLFENGENQ